MVVVNEVVRGGQRPDGPALRAGTRWVRTHVAESLAAGPVRLTFVAKNNRHSQSNQPRGVGSARLNDLRTTSWLPPRLRPMAESELLASARTPRMAQCWLPTTVMHSLHGPGRCVSIS
eukprot:SAG25_NODE_231_length_11417_cov_12.831684_1_plen_118_part_00